MSIDAMNPGLPVLPADLPGAAAPPRPAAGKALARLCAKPSPKLTP